MRKTKLHLALTLALLPLMGNAYAASDIADAAMVHDFEKLEQLIAAGADVNEAQTSGGTALHWAVQWGDPDAVDALITAGADVDAATPLGATPLYLASMIGHPEMIAKLLNAGADVQETVLENEETVLMFAARSNNVDSVKLLLDAGVPIDAKEAYRGTTALHWAAEEGHTAVVQLLLERGANPNLRSDVKITAGGFGPAQPTGGVTPLILASREGALETAKALLAAEALINQQSGGGHTPLLTAVQNGHAELATLLLDHGADPSLANDQGWTPLYLAVKGRTPEVGTMPNPDVTSDALFDLIELLLEKGAKVDARISANSEVRNAIRATWLEEDGGTAFLRAAMGGDLPVMELLLAHGADPTVPTRDGTTALMALAGVGFTNGFMEDFGGHEQSLEAMRLLLNLGLDVNAKNSDGTMALHGACHKNFVGAIQLLVDHGADLTSRSFRRGTFERSKEFAGYTPLDWAQGVQTGGESALYNPEASELMESILTERGIPIERMSNTRGGRVVGSN